VTAQFSENLHASGITPNHVLLVGAVSGAHTPAALDFNTGTQTLTMTYADYLPQDSYTLTLVSGEELEGLSDSSVNALDGEFSPLLDAGFRQATDGGRKLHRHIRINAPPSVVAVEPAANALNVPEASNVSVSFSEQVAASSVNTTTFRLLAGVAPVSASISLSTDGKRATLDPVAPLTLDTLYTVEVTSGVTDLTASLHCPIRATSGRRRRRRTRGRCPRCRMNPVESQRSRGRARRWPARGT